jgi:hypothetical protein
MGVRRLPKKILTYNTKKKTKHRAITVKMEGATYSSRGWNRPSMTLSMK